LNINFCSFFFFKILFYHNKNIYIYALLLVNLGQIPAEITSGGQLIANHTWLQAIHCQRISKYSSVQKSKGISRLYFWFLLLDLSKCLTHVLIIYNTFQGNLKKTVASKNTSLVPTLRKKTNILLISHFSLVVKLHSKQLLTHK